MEKPNTNYIILYELKKVKNPKSWSMMGKRKDFEGWKNKGLGGEM
jgi:hypothetical protein